MCIIFSLAGAQRRCIHPTGHVTFTQQRVEKGVEKESRHDEEDQVTFSAPACVIVCIRTGSDDETVDVRLSCAANVEITTAHDHNNIKG